MIDVLRTLTALVSNFSEVDSSKLQTVIKNLQSALPISPMVQVDETEAEALLQFPPVASTDGTSSTSLSCSADIINSTLALQVY